MSNFEQDPGMARHEVEPSELTMSDLEDTYTLAVPIVVEDQDTGATRVEVATNADRPSSSLPPQAPENL